MLVPERSQNVVGSGKTEKPMHFRPSQVSLPTIEDSLLHYPTAYGDVSIPVAYHVVVQYITFIK